MASVKKLKKKPVDTVHAGRAAVIGGKSDATINHGADDKRFGPKFGQKSIEMPRFLTVFVRNSNLNVCLEKKKTITLRANFRFVCK